MTRAIWPYVVPAGVDPKIANVQRIADVEGLARWLDYAFVLPGGFRFGFAGIVGLIPGVGDVVDALISLYIVGRAIQLGIPRVAITRMLMNVGIEALAGSVPFIGDLFDVVFKANKRNYLLLQSHLSQPERQRASDWIFVIVLAGLVLLSIALPLVGLVELMKRL